MKKIEFLSELEEHLVGISKDDKSEILQDYEEHFKIGRKKKRAEAEISKSLGNPKLIAREVRRELSKPSGTEDLKNEAIETFVAVKKLTKHVFNETKEKTEEVVDNFNKNKYGDRRVLFWILGIFAFISIFVGFSGNGFFLFLALALWTGLVLSHIRNKKTPSKKLKANKSNKKEKQISTKISPFKLILVLLFNIFIFIGFWLGLFFTILGLFVASFACVLTSFIVIAFAIFGLAVYNNQATIDILLSTLFAGIGVSIFSFLFTSFFEKVLKVFFIITKKYIELNSRFIRK